MLRLLSKITLIVAALTLISAQARAQSTNGMPVLYRNGEPVSRGAPPQPRPEDPEIIEPSDPETVEDTSDSAVLEIPAEVEPVIVPPPIDHGAAEVELPEAATGLLAPPETDSGIVSMVMSLGLIVIPIGAVGFAFFYFRKRRKAGVIDDAIPLPGSGLPDSPSKLREALAEMRGQEGQSL